MPPLSAGGGAVGCCCCCRVICSYFSVFLFRPGRKLQYPDAYPLPAKSRPEATHPCFFCRKQLPSTLSRGLPRVSDACSRVPAPCYNTYINRVLPGALPLPAHMCTEKLQALFCFSLLRGSRSIAKKCLSLPRASFFVYTCVHICMCVPSSASWPRADRDVCGARPLRAGPGAAGSSLGLLSRARQVP